MYVYDLLSFCSVKSLSVLFTDRKTKADRGFFEPSRTRNLIHVFSVSL